KRFVVTANEKTTIIPSTSGQRQVRKRQRKCQKILGAGIQSPLGLKRAYLGDGAAVAAAAGAFCGVEVLFPIFFDRLRTFAPFLRWVFGITIILSVMLCPYGVVILLGSGPVAVITPALP